MPTDAASLDSSIAPSSDSSASRSWGGTRAPLGTGWGAARSVRGRVSSKAWTTAPLLCPLQPGDHKAPIGVGKARDRVDKPCTNGSPLWTLRDTDRHPTMMGAGCVRARRTPQPLRLAALTSTVTTAVTSGNSSTVTSKVPVSLMCSGSTTCLRSTSTPLAARMASTTSAGPMEPKRRPPPGRPGADRDHGAGQQADLGLGGAPVLGLPQVTAPAHQLGLALDALGGHDGPALGEQEVAGEPARHLHDVTPAAHAGDVVSQEDLHASAPASSGSTTTSTTAPASASATASSTMARASATSASASAGHRSPRARRPVPSARARASAAMESPSVRSPRSRPPRPPGRSVTVRCV